MRLLRLPPSVRPSDRLPLSNVTRLVPLCIANAPIFRNACTTDPSCFKPSLCSLFVELFNFDFAHGSTVVVYFWYINGSVNQLYFTVEQRKFKCKMSSCNIIGHWTYVYDRLWKDLPRKDPFQTVGPTLTSRQAGCRLARGRN